MPAADEERLIVQIKEGDHEAYGVLVRRYMKQAYDLAFSFVNDHDDADDVTQDAFVRAYRSIKSFRQGSQFRTWLYRIVVNLSLNLLKQRRRILKREFSVFSLLARDVASDPAAPYDLDLRMHVERALYQLSTLQRSVVILRCIDGLSTKQVSEILGCSDGTVKKHLHRGLRKMRAMLDFLKHEHA